MNTPVVIKKAHTPTTIILFIAVLVLLWMQQCGNNKQITIGMYESLADTLHTVEDELGRERSQTSLLITNKEKLFLKIRSQDSTITKLQDQVKDYKGKLFSAIRASSSTLSSGNSESVVLSADTVYKDSIAYVHAVYSTRWNNRWEKGFIEAGIDSIHRSIKITNEYAFNIGYKREKWWKRSRPIVEMQNLNPNTSTLELRSVSIRDKKPRIRFGLTASYGFILPTLDPSLHVGFGAQLPIF